MSRGSKPGERRGGRQKGSLNKSNRDLKELAQVHTPAALKALVEILKSSDYPAARVAAAKELLDRGHGRAPVTATIEWTASESLLEALRKARERAWPLENEPRPGETLQ